jgi:hypothetical protein
LWPIDVSNNRNKYNLLFALVFFFSLFSSIRSRSHHPNLQGCRGSCLSTVQMLLGWRRSPSSKPSGAPDCHRSRQNQIIRFTKSDSLFSTVSSRSFQLCSIRVPTNTLLLQFPKPMNLHPCSQHARDDQIGDGQRFRLIACELSCPVCS